MPNTKPPVTGIKSLESKKRAVSSKAYVDYGLFAAITKNLDVAAVADRVAGFKLFMGSTTGRILMNDDALIERAMAAIAPTGKRISVHAEDDNLIRRDGERNDRDHMRNRPPEAEHSAIRRLGRYRGCRLTYATFTNAESLALDHPSDLRRSNPPLSASGFLRGGRCAAECDPSSEGPVHKREALRRIHKRQGDHDRDRSRPPYAYGQIL